MYYYEVLVASQRYHSEKPLTYSFATSLEAGSLVTVPLQRQKVVAVVVAKTAKPSFTTKEILTVISLSTLPKELLQLIDWLKDYYPAPFGQIVSLFLPSTLATKSRKQLDGRPSPTLAKPLPDLTKEQKVTIKAILDTPGSILLHGDTGTGKTRVYLEIAKQVIKSGKSVIILTPEIGLTPQLVAAFESHFPHQTLVLHSELTPSERRSVWLEALDATSPMIALGPRSALFAPLKNIGLIVLDEFHEPAYKQEQAPYYRTSRVAARLAQLHNAQLILGSATPTIEDYYTFDSKKLPILRMREQALKHDQPRQTVIVDLKDRSLFSNSPWISDVLLDQIKAALGRGEQSLIFLNRRGTARQVLCSRCGWQAVCPRCDLPLTYHGDIHTMSCHTCGFTTSAITTCPECSSFDIVFKGVGTKAMVQEIQRLLPNTKVQRFDSDMAKHERLEHHFSLLKAGSADILVGTQMLGKGLDLPLLSVVGIITAETSLAFPDYTAQERTFQLITQALGRVHRGHTPGSAVVQTYHPDSTLLKAAVNNDYEGFYTAELAQRELFRFPPFRFVLKLSCSRASSTAAKKASLKLTSEIRAMNLPLEIAGPTPAFTEKIHNKYRWQIIVSAKNRKLLVDIIRNLPPNWTHDIDPMNLL